MPSEGETYGMVTLEALASGLPVIGTNRDGTEEILNESAKGALYEPGDVTDFVMKLDKLERSRVAGKALPAKFRFDEMVLSTEAVLKKL
jgi:glycosyltransferase involved in cell wall biosynthesis